MIFRHQELLFRGSKERLKRNIAKMGGDFSAPGRFRLLWRSHCFKWALSFRMTAEYERSEAGIRIRYRFLPTAVTLFWSCLPVTFLMGFALWEMRDGNLDSAMAMLLLSLMYPAVLVWQYRSCHKALRRYFSIVTQ
ncbi:MAG: hypothetical protein IJE81_06155 [Oscillospiraceae bacterium]|nr:hypothetical protein [Oscillospiraceae bacterium]MBQ7130080.1 hypothetical protein [Oscillospiraceae bacterium]